MEFKNFKLVDFNGYCKRCKHKKVKESESPCNECLAVGARLYSAKPEKFEERKEK